MSAADATNETRSIDNDSQGHVDLIAQAREAQWSEGMLDSERVVKVLAPAKVNLFLDVEEKRSDGYHEVVNVMHTLALHDTLYVGFSEGLAAGADATESASVDVAYAGAAQNIAVQIQISDKTVEMHETPLDVPTERNLVFKAIDMLAEAIEWDRPCNINIRIEKNIPYQAGLGGGSSDAAAALIAMSHFWGVSTAGETLAAVAAKVGADTAFFLKGGCATLSGVGEVFERSLPTMKSPVVIVKPNVGVSTPQAYTQFDEHPVVMPAELLALVEDANDASEVFLANNLACAAYELEPELLDVWKWLDEQSGVMEQTNEPGFPRDSEIEAAAFPKKAVLLCGSGAATFAITETMEDALRIVGAAKAKGWWARSTSFCALRAELLA